MSSTHLTETRFSDFDLPEVIAKGIEASGFTHCTPIQAETLPLALNGRDVAGQAQTGTGKSAAFLIATLNHLLTRPATEDRKPTQPRAMILAPTRELAIQIQKDAAQLAQFTDLKLVLAYGGTGYDSQRQAILDGVDILVGTPGRIIDYFKQGIFDLKAAQVMVMDEADRMFDLGFIKDIRYLLRHMPPPAERLNLMFSATLAQRVMELAFEHMNEATTVNVVADTKTADRVRQSIYHTANEEKIPLLVGLLRHMDPSRSMVFANMKFEVERIAGWLNTNGLPAAAISGDVPQSKRQRLLKDFSEGRLPVLVATDVAARGLHIPEVSHVFNYDLPNDREDYVHRIGRTARAGADGDAISFACENYAFHLVEIEEYIGHKIPVKSITDELLARDLAKPAARPRRERDDRKGRGSDRADDRSQRGRQGGRRDEQQSPRPQQSDEDRVQQTMRSDESVYRKQPDEKPIRKRPVNDIPVIG
ncbi:MAG: ATP-dependent RNA helicase RhlB [Gammaproteobacteria bacterium]|nr:ATP-dependent RNA helicase RhlB [Gammaproteobacteria bacterium]